MGGSANQSLYHTPYRFEEKAKGGGGHCNNRFNKKRLKSRKKGEEKGTKEKGEVGKVYSYNL